MTTSTADLPTTTARTWAQRCPVYYGWVNVVMASLAMTATLPGRTHGLGLITEPLLTDLSLDKLLFANINLWSSLIGAAFCLPIGYLIDRLGVRAMLAAVVLLLAAAVWGMSFVTGAVSLCAALIVVRGLGQSSLSIISMAMIGKWFRRRTGAAMGLFSVLLTFGFIGSILGMGEAVAALGWRSAWGSMAPMLLLFAPLGWLIVRSTPESCGVAADVPEATGPDGESTHSFTLGEALRTPAFWVFVLGTSAFNMVWSAVMLFNESIMAERGFNQSVSVQVLAILTGVGLASNLMAGALATRARIAVLLGTGLTVLAASLGIFPYLQSIGQVRLYAVGMGITGGIIMVVFFGVWGHVFGRRHLGKIQGAAQLISVLASALGPIPMAWCEEHTGSYMPMFSALAIGISVLAIAAFLVPLPACRRSGDVDEAALDACVGGLQPAQD